VSRSKKDCFYVNKDHLLRAHMTAHDQELIRSGLDAFLTFGDVYRRDEIDRTHYPIFHQCDSVRLFNESDVILNIKLLIN
jgi:phenylalanyl-tRNA synthetase alpha chain